MINFSDFKWQSSLIITLSLMTIFSNAVSLGIFVNADNLNPGIYSKDSKPFGVTYGDWLAKWNQWFINIPPTIHPREHYTPERCAIDQSGPVWFLTDTLGQTNNQTNKLEPHHEIRTCTIPAGKAILLPILSGSAWDDHTNPDQKTDQGLTKSATEGNNYGIISATLDGKEIQNLNSYRTQSPFFNITIPKDNVFNNVPGVWKAKIDGFFLFIEPLPPGNHTLHTKTLVMNPVAPSFNYAADLTYNLIVKP